MFPFRSKVKELQKTITTLEEIIANNRHTAWKQYVQLQEAETAKEILRDQLGTAWETIQENEEQFKLIKQGQAMNETVEMSKLRGEISILKEELQRIKIVAEREKNRADINYAFSIDLEKKLAEVIEEREQGVEKEREQSASKAPAHCEEKTGIDAILAEREKTHGSFETHANCTQLLEDTFYSFKLSHFYNSVMREGLHMIFHKLGRIAAGSQTHKDHWDDIAGYSTLVSRSLEGE